ncbi:YrhK family protein [Georgenia sp. 10Sc9-8]|uniref:YrhK family protein n=1 Tax=Georgenia halotolerans TaxID=3028317 RepID=A0ABT5TWI1_9MICO|nr:YrhK family protein [Georgenia halotolerans]
MGTTAEDHPVQLPLGHEKVVIDNKYETLSIINDVLIAVFFVAGSIMFYFESLQTEATTMFLLGSIDFLLRPVIRLARRVHLKRLGHPSSDGSQDY